jgi:hypothetical protein
MCLLKKKKKNDLLLLLLFLLFNGVSLNQCVNQRLSLGIVLGSNTWDFSILNIEVKNIRRLLIFFSTLWFLLRDYITSPKALNCWK